MKYALMFIALFAIANETYAQEFEAAASSIGERGTEVRWTWEYPSEEMNSVIRSSCKCGRRHYK